MRVAALLALSVAAMSCGRNDVEVFDVRDGDPSAPSDDDTQGDSVTPQGLIASVTVPAGTFIMGSPASEACREPWSSKETAHSVQLTYDVAMLVTEVTQAQWQSLVGAFPAAQALACDDCPVVSVTWDDAATFCNALSAADTLPSCYACSAGTCTAPADILTCLGWRLPSEAEWERARRADTTGSIYSSDVTTCATDPALDGLAWYIGTTPDAQQTVQAVAQKAANPFGLYDMTGNAWEWCEDWQQVDLGTTSAVDPLLTDPSGFRTTRGGGYSDRAEAMRAAARDSNPPSSRFDYIGLRCVRHL